MSGVAVYGLSKQVQETYGSGQLRRYTFRMDAHAHCGHCGKIFASSGWPRVCDGCHATSYRNPIPVAVVLIPVGGSGLLLIRRAIPPQAGKLALPGGFVNFGETWQDGGAREVREETGLVIDPKSLREIRVCSAGNTVLIFAVAPGLPALPAFTPNAETSEQVVITEPVETAFPFHTEVVREWFAARR